VLARHLRTGDAAYRVQMSRVTRRRQVTRYAAGTPRQRREDVVAVEEPLQIRLRAWSGEQRDLTTTMRTPGDDFDLVAGFLVGEGIVRRSADLATMRYCAGVDASGEQTYNVVDVTLTAGIPLPDSRIERQVTTTSACGICGTTSIDDVVKALPSDPLDEGTVSLDVLLGLPEALRAGQQVFERTGGVHAAGVFASGGERLVVREDVGRHNAVDKVVGWALRAERLPLAATVLQVSGRASFELVQKARLAGIPVLAAVGAPSSLAVELADQVGLTLVGFSRGHSLVAYTHERRIS